LYSTSMRGRCILCDVSTQPSEDMQIFVSRIRHSRAWHFTPRLKTRIISSLLNIKKIISLIIIIILKLI
jgi:hypothetical protein